MQSIPYLSGIEAQGGGMFDKTSVIELGSGTGLVGISVFFSLKLKNRFFSMSKHILGSLQKYVREISEFLRKIIKFKVKIIVETRNTENCRLRQVDIF